MVHAPESIRVRVSSPSDPHPTGGTQGSVRVDPAVEEAVLATLEGSAIGLRVDELVRAPALVQLGARAPEVLRALSALHAVGAVRLGPLRRWQLAGVRPEGENGKAAGAEPSLGGVLRAVPAEVVDLPAPGPDPAPAPDAGEARGRGFAARYLQHAARMLAEEERTRIDVFADRAAETVQPLHPRRAWWPEGERRTLLRLSRALLADAFQAALARRQDDEVALVWGIRVREPRGAEVPVWTPLVAWPALWRLQDDCIEVEPTTPLPSLDPSALRIRTRAERQRVAEWLGLLGDGEDAVAAVDPPELGRRLGPLLREALKEPLDPLALRTAMPLAAREGVYDVLALVLLDRTRYGGGAVRELRELAARAGEGELGATALATLFTDVPAASEAGPLYEPLELSGSQLDAARDATVQPLTVITGPPGTGKSQVVAAIAATVAARGGSVLIASRNHRAIDAVEERLAQLGPGWFLRLSAPEGTRAADWQQLCQLALARAERPPPPGRETLLRELDERDGERRRLLAELDRLLELRERYAEAESAADTLARAGFADPERLIERALPLVRPAWGRRLAESLPVLGRRLRAARRREMEELAAGCPDPAASVEQRLEHALSMAKLALARDGLAQELRASPSREEIEVRLEKLGRTVRELARRLLAAGPHPPLNEETREGLRSLLDALQLAKADGDDRRAREAWKRFGRHLLAQVPIVAVTNLSAASRLPLAPGLFDLLIIDEASQCDIPSALPLFARAKRAVVVGDPMQLRHVARTTPAREAELLRQQGLALDALGPWLCSLRSLFDVAERHASRRHFLAEHYRCHPDIAGYVSRAFYDGRLHPLTPVGTLKPVPGLKPGIHWQEVEGEVRAARSGCWSPAEVAAAVDHVARLLDAGFEGTIGIATPFREQARRLADAVADRFSAEAIERHRLIASSIHQFQGDARDLVLVSLCLGRGMPRGSLEFLRREARLLNVAVSRARVVCLVLGSREVARASGIPHITTLLAHVERRERPTRGEGANPFQSPWEERLYEALAARGLRTVPQYPLVGRFLDLAVPEVRLDIEVDGDFHRGPDGYRRIEDRWRDLQIRAAGWQVMRFWVYELREDLDGCVQRILERVRDLATQG